MSLSDELQWRGLIKDKTFASEDWLNKPGIFYLGIDASADSLTVGNLAILMLARRLVAAGWKAFFVMGGGTSLVGDPGGKNEERALMSRKTVENNIEGVRAQVTKLFKGNDYNLVDNYEWLSKLKYVDFLREVGKHFSMTELMQRDFVVERMGQGGMGISYAEFSYSLVQGYDFWHLFNKHKVVMQIGGSDQWGNLLSGVSLIRKKEAKEAHALSMPLIVNKATGQKFGKTEGGAVWLDAKKTSPYKFYQFWLNVDDESVKEYLKYFTLLSIPDTEALFQKFDKDRSSRLAQKTLAYEVTQLVHGQERADTVQKASEVLFGQGNFLDLGDKETEVLAAELPTVATANDFYDTVVLAGLAGSKSEARNFHASGAISVNGEKLAPGQEIIFRNGTNLLKRGKNSFAIVKK